MIENLVTISEGSIGLAIAEMIGGLVAGMLLMFYRDVAATERMFLLASPFTNRFWDRIALQFWNERPKELGSGWEDPTWMGSVGNEEQFRVDSSELFRFRIGSVKAVTFSLGVVVLGSSLTLIPFSGLGINEAIWTLVGFAVGACIEHAVWLFARIPYDEKEREGGTRSTSEIAETLRRALRNQDNLQSSR
jgi:hypothetical protein